jgi:hypothetical protein
MGNKQAQFHTWVKDSDQSDTGKMGIRIRCLRHDNETLTITEKQLEDYHVPPFQYASRMTSHDTPAEGVREAVAIQFAKVVPNSVIRERNSDYWNAVGKVEKLIDQAISDRLTEVLAELPGKSIGQTYYGPYMDEKAIAVTDARNSIIREVEDLLVRKGARTRKELE